MVRDISTIDGVGDRKRRGKRDVERKKRQNKTHLLYHALRMHFKIILNLQLCGFEEQECSHRLVAIFSRAL